jgi:hypothetical protein
LAKKKNGDPKQLVLMEKIVIKNSMIKNVATKKLGIENMAIKRW